MMTRSDNRSLVLAARPVRYCILCLAVVSQSYAFLFLVGCGADDDRSGPEPTSSQHPAVEQAGFDPVDFPEGNAELQRLADRFGVKYYSWHHEEWFIRDFFNDMRGGFFVDVGASHYSRTNNTFFLEDVLEWSGIAIDAQERYREGYVKNRPRTQYFTYFVSDKSTSQQTLYIPENVALASGNKDSLEFGGHRVTETAEVPEITLNDLLDREGVEKIDFLSMDIELAEPAALRGFDIQRFAPKLVCIEEFSHNREVLEAYFAENGYARIELWSRIDSYNSYYTPRELVGTRRIPDGAER